MAPYHNPPTDKQLRYIESLARNLGLGGDAWDHFPGSRSKAQRKATSRDASDVIDTLQARLAEREAREGLPDGAVHGGAVRIGGSWVKLTAAALEVWVATKERVTAVPDWAARLQTRREELKVAGDPTPYATAMRELAAGGQDAARMEARAQAIEQIRALMRAHGITLEEVRVTVECR